MSTYALLLFGLFADMIQPMVDKKIERGKRIRRVIQDSGKTQREIAEIVGVAPQSVTKWMTTGKISLESIEALADVTGLDIRYLMSGTNPPAVAEHAALYHTQHHELHRFIDTLNDKRAQQLFACAQAIKENDDENADVTIAFNHANTDDK